MEASAASLIDDITVPHTAFLKARRILSQCLRYAASSKVPVCVALIGESRTGKTFLLDEIREDNPEVRTPEGLIVPVLYVETPSKPSPNNLAEEMLNALGDPIPGHGTESAKTRRLGTLLLAAKTRMIQIDEFQHFVDQRSRKVWYEVANWLKLLADKTRISIVVSGLAESRYVISQNPQLAARFLAPIAMQRFDWSNDDQREEFLAILGAFDEGLRPRFDLPEMAGEGMAFRLYCATGGLVGYLANILRQALRNAIDANTKLIKLEDIALAFEEAVAVDDKYAAALAPFSPDFNTLPTPEFIHATRQVGVESVDSPEADAPPPKRRRGRPPSAASVLTTN